VVEPTKLTMLRNRTTLVLGGIAALLLGYILFVDEGTLSTGELEGRAGHVVERFVRARVKRLELTHGDVHLVLERDQSEEEDMETFDVGTWALTEPVEGAADVDAVDALLGAVEWLDAQRELSGITAEDRTRFGFDAPRATLVFEVATETHTIHIGGDDPRGEGVYVQVDDPSRAYVVGSDFLEALTHEVDHFRSKELFADFRTADVVHATLVREGGTLELERSGRRWHLRQPIDLLAQASRVDETLRALRDARAERFLAEPPEGLGASTLTLSFAPWPEGSTHEGEERPDVVVSLGGECPEHPGERVLRVDEGPTVCVAAAALEALDRPADDYRELRLVASPDDEIERLVVEGPSRFELRRTEGDWELVVGEAATPADPAAIEEWVADLRALSAASFEPFSEALASERGLGDGEARTTLTIHRSGEDDTEVLRLGGADDDGVWVRRGDEAQLAQFALAAVDLLSPSAVRFRSRALVTRSRDDLATFRVTRGGDAEHEETLHQEGSSWVIETPIEGRADGAAVGDLADAIAPLAALRFVADLPATEHGLEAPRFVLFASFDAPSADDEAEEEEHDHGDEEAEHAEDEGEEAEREEAEGPLEITLRIGAATEGGAFAQLAGETAVFVVPQALIDALDEPFVSRDALSIAASEIQTLAFERTSGTHTLLRTEGGWQLDGADAPSEPTLAMLDALAGLRASGATSYAPAAIADAVLTLRITKRDGSAVTIEIGPASGEGDAASHAVRRTPDVPAGLRCAPSALERVLSYPPS
jgi:hypothetical protein